MVTLLCLATEKGLEVLKTAIEMKASVVVCFSNDKDMKEKYATEIMVLAYKHKIETIPWGYFKDNTDFCLNKYKFTQILCVSWQYLFRDDLKEMTTVAHDSLLPKLRGFAPLVTAMLEKHTFTGVTFLTAGESCDSGDILWQGSIPILKKDTIKNLIQRITPLYKKGARLYLEGKLTSKTKQSTKPTFSIWRDKEDYTIDWFKSSEDIDLHVRAHGVPYYGAKTTLNGHEVTVYQVEIVEDKEFSIRQPGKVWELTDGYPTVVCGQGMLKITDARVGDRSIIPMSKLRNRFKS